MSAPIWWVYGLIDGRDGFVFYVGITKHPSRRLYQHKTQPDSAAFAPCREILAEGADVRICKFMGTYDEEAARYLERHLIIGIPQTYNRTFFPDGWKFWEPIREKMRTRFSLDEMREMGHA